MEVQASDFRTVAAIELVGGPGAVDKFAVKDAIADDELADMGDAGVDDGLNPEVEEFFDVDAAVIVHEAEQLGVAEGGVAAAEDDEAVAVVEQACIKFEVAAEHVQRCAGGEEFEIACGDQGLIGVDLADRCAGICIADAQAQGSAAQGCREDGPFDFHLYGCNSGKGQVDQQKQKGGDEAGLEAHGGSVCKKDKLVEVYRTIVSADRGAGLQSGWEMRRWANGGD